ncbi:MAG: hypothetical protein ACXVLT_09470 [Flavisolibacter sp.]
MNKLCIATISLARSEEEDKALRESLSRLAKSGLPVFVTDGGSPERFRTILNSLPNFNVLQAKGLWPQAKSSIRAAKDAGADFILYTEPDKLEFFSDHLHKLLEQPIDDSVGVLLAGRSAKGFASFPSFQQMTETAINNCCKEIIGKDIDYCYGPFLFNSRLIAYLDVLDDNCGWGWRPFVFAVAHRLGLRVEGFEGDFNCPVDQREDDEGERIYRMKQLTQNINGLVQATTIDISKGVV